MSILPSLIQGRRLTPRLALSQARRALHRACVAFVVLSGCTLRGRGGYTDCATPGAGELVRESVERVFTADSSARAQVPGGAQVIVDLDASIKTVANAAGLSVNGGGRSRAAPRFPHMADPVERHVTCQRSGAHPCTMASAVRVMNVGSAALHGRDTLDISVSTWFTGGTATAYLESRVVTFVCLSETWRFSRIGPRLAAGD